MDGFGWLDWTVVFGFLALTTWVGERCAGKQQSLRDFFLGGRKLPWYAVSASIVATEISAVTFISLPFVVFREGGDITYLQLGVIGALLARLLVARYLVPAYYEREIYSPYDYMSGRLGEGVRPVASGLFAIGGILAQCARVYLTAVVLEVVLAPELGWFEARTGIPPLVGAVCAIGLVAVAWTWIGGIATVVWTDAILFLVFIAGMTVTLVTVSLGVEGGMGTVLSSAWEAGKMRFVNADPSPTQSYTIWVALIAAPWWLAGVYGTDQLFAQRLFCCKSERDAKKAVLASQVGVLVTCLAALVGMGLFAYYDQYPLTGEALALYEEKGDRIFPLFVLEHVPAGLKGLILAGAFAAAISSLDSIMAALSQTTLAAVWLPRRRRALGLAADAPLPAEEERRSVRLSRLLVVAFGVLLCTAAVLTQRVHAAYPSILDMALAMAGYTQGALLAGVVLAWLGRRGTGSGFVWAAPLSVLTVYALAWHGDTARTLCWVGGGLLVLAWCAARARGDLARGVPRAVVLRQVALLAAGVGGVLALNQWAYAPGADGAAPRVLAYPWFVPVGSTVTLVFAFLLARRERVYELTASPPPSHAEAGAPGRPDRRSHPPARSRSES